MKNLAATFAAGIAVLGALAATYDGKVLSGEWLIDGSEDVVVNGTVTGTGDIRFRQTSGKLTLNCVHEAAGDIYVDWGEAYLKRVEALGKGRIYVNDETTSGRAKKLHIAAGMTITNTITLGTEATVNWAARMSVDTKSTVTLKGPVIVNASKFMSCAGGKLVVAGGVSGNKAVLAMGGDYSQIEVCDTPVNLTAGFYVGGPGWVPQSCIATLNVAGNAAAGLYGFDGVTLKLGVDNPFTSEIPFAPVANKSFNLDLNGHSINLGSCANEGAGYGGTSRFTVCNSSSSLPTISVNQQNDNVGIKTDGVDVGAALAVSGRMNFTKKGAAKLMPVAFDIKDGTLRVDAGTFRLKASGTPVKFASTIVVAGGTLDLNGGSYSCMRLEQRGGKIVNGTLTVLGENVIYADTDVTATLVGKTVTAGLTFRNALGAGAPAPFAYDLPDGTVCFMPFDTADTLSFDYGSCRADVYVASGAPSFASNGKAGGCLYLDGSSYLKATQLPSGFPSGAHPVTVSCWVKVADGCSNRGGWFSYGSQDKGCGSSYCFESSFDKVKWYANDVDVRTSVSSSLNDGAWHHVVGVWDGTFRDLYVDGVRKVHASGLPLNTGSAIFMVGKTMWDANFTGWIDELLVLDRAASEADVAALYAADIRRTVPDTADVSVASGALVSGSGSLAVAYPFDSADAFLRDASQTGATLSNSGATFSNDSAFGSGGSASFNGSSSFLSLASFPSAIPSGNAPRTLLCFVKGTTDESGEGAFISYGNEGWTNGKYFNFAFRLGGKSFGLFPWGAENGTVSLSPRTIFSTSGSLSPPSGMAQKSASTPTAYRRSRRLPSMACLRLTQAPADSRSARHSTTAARFSRASSTRSPSAIAS